MKSPFFISDLEILSKLFLPKDAACNLIHSTSKVVQDSVIGMIHHDAINANAAIVLPNSNVDKDTLSSYSYLIDFSGITLPKHRKLTFGYFSNPDGSIRWIYPEWLPNTGFLSFYNNGNFKSKILAASIRMGFSLGLQNIMRSGSFSLYFNDHLNPTFENVLSTQSSFSVFTGTVGQSRKIQIEISNNGQTKYFIKIPFTCHSQRNVDAEIHNLLEVKSLQLSHTVVPGILPAPEKHLLVTENIRFQNSTISPEFNYLHAKSLAEIYSKTFHSIELPKSKFYQGIQQQLSWLESCKNFKFNPSMISNCKQILDSIPAPFTIGTSLAHRDFTSWNMFTSENTLYLFDWESAKKEIPLLYDFFHFHFQKGILIDRKNFPEILVEIHNNLQKPEMQSIVAQYKIDIRIHMALYLVGHVCEYLVHYQKQERLHLQVNWLTDTWSEALEYLKVEFNHQGVRNYIISDFIAHLEPFAFTWMKSFGKSCHHLSEYSDIDLLIEKKHLPAILSVLDRYALYANIKMVRKSFMTTVSIYFHNQEFLSIDLIYEFKRKHIHYLNPAKILGYAGVNSEGIRVPQFYHDLEYIVLFYTLNNDTIPSKYTDHFLSLTEAEQDSLLLYFQVEYKIEASSLKEFLLHNKQYKVQLAHKSKQMMYKSSILKRFKSLLNYGVDTFREILFNRGFVITLSGVDGAGKSTIIESLKETFEKKYRKKVKLLRHRPSLLPILSSYVYGKAEAEKRTTASLPRQGKNSSSISSALRFLYYFADYQIGQIYIWVRYILRGHIVLYDRYYFDFIEDSKRTNIHLPNSLTSYLYKFIYKPRLNVLLYAKPEVILARKKELSEDDIVQLTSSYLHLFQKLSVQYRQSAYLSIENINKETTIQQILRKVPLTH
jgi:thymidylate kinase